MNKIEQIKAEIERLKAKYRPLVWSEDSEKSKEGGYKIEALNELMLSLQEEQLSEDLEIAAQRSAIKQYKMTTDIEKAKQVLSARIFHEIGFKAGADWQKEQKPILEVFGFKVGDVVRLKDGDGRKHIIKSFEEVEGVHGPNFYHVEFEDDSARDGIYPGEEYPNGYYTQMEKFEEEQKTEWSEDIIRKAVKEVGLTQHQINWLKTNVFPPKQEWSEEDEKMYIRVNKSYIELHGYVKDNPVICESCANHIIKKTEEELHWLKSLRDRFIKEAEQ